MILSGQTIRLRGIFSPFCERSVTNGMSYGLSACGYDVRLDLSHLPLEYSRAWLLQSGKFVLAATIEHMTIPKNLVAMVHDKSTWARRGLAVQNTIAEPGWRGWLTLELTNHGPDALILRHGDPIAQIVFHTMDQEASEPYNGKYQDQQRGPQKAREE